VLLSATRNITKFAAREVQGTETACSYRGRFVEGTTETAEILVENCHTILSTNFKTPPEAPLNGAYEELSTV
jgi:hypothetical protein